MAANKNRSAASKRGKKTHRKRRGVSSEDEDEYERAADVSLTSSSQDEILLENS